MAAETITEDLGKAHDSSSSTAAGKAQDKPAKSRTAKKKASAKRAPSKRAPSKAQQEALVASSARALALPRELGGLVCLAIALLLLLAVVSFTPADLEATGKVENLIGPVGARLGDWLLTIFGLGAFCFDALLWYLGFAILVGKRPEWRPMESFGQLFFVLSGTMLAHLALGHYLFFGHPAGGFVGQLGAELTRGFFGTVGAYIVTLSLLLTSLMFVTDVSLGSIVRAIAARCHELYAYSRHNLRVHTEYRARLKEERRLLIERESGDVLQTEARLAAELSLTPITQRSYAFEEQFEQDVEERLSQKLGRLLGKRGARSPELEAPKRASRKKKSEEDPVVAPREREQDEVEPPEEQVAVTAPRIQPRRTLVDEAKRAAKDEGWSMGEGEASADHDPLFVHHQVDDARAHTMAVGEEDLVEEEDFPASAERGEVAPLGEDGGDFGPRIVESSAKERAKRIKELLATDDDHGVLFKPQKRGDFELPQISFLNYEDNDEQGVDIEQLRAMAAQIEKTLRDFKVEGQIRDICPGPVITVFEFSPAPGVKISKISTLADDLAMALSALSVRIVAPIPGKGVVGIEVPNPTREMVYMKEIIADKMFYENQKMALPMGLGKDTSGSPVVTDLAKMPHLLVAGATGAGKSVAVNTMITSLLYRNSPDDVRLIMVDPKMLEFSIYADIPHLLLPVVTDPKQATIALNWAVQEMERRYQKLADLNVRNIKGYNVKVADLTAQAQVDLAEGKDDTKAIRSLSLDAQGKPEHVHMPYIVVIIDEFADLMMTASKDVETAVARLAQKARAAGIHLILATQRPSTDVITGLIKANFPTRIALRVTSKTDSRVILDSNGAENLLGNGDMLFMPPGSSYIQRVHGAYVSEKEIELVVDFLKEQGEPQYNDEILKVEEEEGAEVEEDDFERDEHYADAVRLVIESRQASISMIQRKLRVGYNRAARMVEVMEKDGIVSAPDGCRPREVLLDVSPY